MYGSSSGNAEMVYLLVSGCIFHTLEGEGVQLVSRVFWGPGYWWLGMVKPLSQILHVWYIYCTMDSVAIKTGLDISNLQVDL